MQKVDFRYSDTDFVAYLLSLGYKQTYIEVTKDRNGKFKVFIHFYQDKDELLRHFNEFKNGDVKVDVLNFSINRRTINKLIKWEVTKVQDQEIKNSLNNKEEYI